MHTCNVLDVAQLHMSAEILLLSLPARARRVDRARTPKVEHETATALVSAPATEELNVTMSALANSETTADIRVGAGVWSTSPPSLSVITTTGTCMAASLENGPEGAVTDACSEYVAAPGILEFCDGVTVICRSSNGKHNSKERR
jgi:hypothetical protein